MLNKLRKKYQSGFSMIEVLVTILVFAVGLLGVLSLQTTGMRMVRDADLAGHASLLASSMAEKMRSNLAGDTYTGVDNDDRDCEEDDSCSVAQEDVFAWNDEISETLPGGSGSVTQSGTIFTISVTWTESGDSTAAGQQRTHSLPVEM